MGFFGMSEDIVMGHSCKSALFSPYSSGIILILLFIFSYITADRYYIEPIGPSDKTDEILVIDRVSQELKIGEILYLFLL
jgi:hypothetical protein